MEQDYYQILGNHEMREEKQEQKKKTNPIDTTELFERYMGIKR